VFSSAWLTTRGLAQDGQRRPFSNWVMQSRQRAGIWVLI
jgi:hypothetical protein